MTEPEWQPWPGGECPVPPETCVHFRTRIERYWKIEDAAISEDNERTADSLRWKHADRDDDIIAYRVLP